MKGQRERLHLPRVTQIPFLLLTAGIIHLSHVGSGDDVQVDLELRVIPDSGQAAIFTGKDIVAFLPEFREIELTSLAMDRFKRIALPGGRFQVLRRGELLWEGELVASWMSRSVDSPVIYVEPLPEDDPGADRVRIDLSYPPDPGGLGFLLSV